MIFKYEWIFLFFGLAFLIWIYFLQKKLKVLSFELMEKNQNHFLRFTETTLNQQYLRAKEDLEHRQKSIEQSITPIKDLMEKLENKTQEMEKKREVAYSGLHQQLQNLIEAEKELRLQTTNLSIALKSPSIRGTWGQIHLKRVVELAGLLDCCDFYEQKTLEKEGKLLRPDLLVRLPGEKFIVIDSKAPMESYYSALEEKQEDRKKQKLQDHAVHLRRHVRQLSSKEYYKQFTLTPEYVILFLPAESFFSAALRVDPALIESSAKENIVIATPTTLIAILRAIAQIWSEDKMHKNTLKIAELGIELHDRVFTLTEHWNRLGRNLNMTVDAYNQASSSLESRVIVSTRKFKELGVNSPNELEIKESIDKFAKTVHSEKKT